MNFKSIISFSLTLIFLWNFAGIGNNLMHGLNSSEDVLILHKTCPKKLKKNSGRAFNFKTAKQLQVKEVACTSAFRLEVFQWSAVNGTDGFQEFSYYKLANKNRHKDPRYPPPKMNIHSIS